MGNAISGQPVRHPRVSLGKDKYLMSRFKQADGEFPTMPGQGIGKSHIRCQKNAQSVAPLVVVTEI
jgi:hypothetical protein